MISQIIENKFFNFSPLVKWYQIQNPNIFPNIFLLNDNPTSSVINQLQFQISFYIQSERSNSFWNWEDLNVIKFNFIRCCDFKAARLMFIWMKELWNSSELRIYVFSTFSKILIERKLFFTIDSYKVVFKLWISCILLCYYCLLHFRIFGRIESGNLS